jgi:hypothetical protein
MPDDEAKLGSAEKVDESTSKRKLISDDLQPSRIKKKKALGWKTIQNYFHCWAQKYLANMSFINQNADYWIMMI